MFNYQGKLAYKGNHFHGWQKQKNCRDTVQEYMENAIYTVTGEEVTVIGAGRTDAGVHACGQVCSFKLRKELSPDKLLMGINANVPINMAIISLQRAGETFHALRDARQKWYRYRILNRRVRCPLRQDFVHFFPQPLEVGFMKEGAQLLVGEHDFSSFCASGSTAKTRIRRLLNLEIERVDDEVILDFRADGFLYRMVRLITGTLLEVGRGEMAFLEIEKILLARDTRRAGPAAPTRGLMLMGVNYDESSYD